MTARKVALTILCIVCILLMSGLQKSPAVAQASTCTIVHPGMTFSANECESYELLFTWVASTPGLVNVFQKASKITLTVTGVDNYFIQYTPAQSSKLWLPKYSISPADFGWECSMSRIWGEDFVAPIGNHLAPGEYLITVRNDISHPLTDGLQLCTQNGDFLGKMLYRGPIEFKANFIVTK